MATTTVVSIKSLSPARANIAWARGKPILVVTPAYERVIRNPSPIACHESSAGEHRMSQGLKLFPEAKFYLSGT